jgi:hypothetical protein
MQSEVKYVNKDINFLRKVFLSEDNIYKIVQGYKLKSGEQKVEKKVYETVEVFCNAFVTKMKNYDGDVITWVENMNKIYIDMLYSTPNPASQQQPQTNNKSKNGSGFVRTDTFTMEDYKHYVPLREPINTVLNQRNRWYSHQNKHKVMINKIAKPEDLEVQRLETGNFVPKQSPWSEAYMKVKMAASNRTKPTAKNDCVKKMLDSANYKPEDLHDVEEYNYTLF